MEQSKTSKKNQANPQRTKALKKEIRHLKKDEKLELKMGGMHGRNAEAMSREIQKAAKVQKIPRAPRTSMHMWLKALSSPFDGRSIPCPVNYCPAPSLLSTTLTVTHNRSINVGAATVTQIVLFPGHCSAPLARPVPSATGGAPAYYPILASQIDATSFHSRLINMRNGGNVPGPWSVGPLNDSNGVVFSAMGGIKENLALNTVSSNCTDWIALQPDVTMPYRQTLSDDPGYNSGHHVRWRLDSMGIRFKNTTPEATRGCVVQSVQITNSGGLQGSTISAQESNPTFRLWTTDDGEISWIPRLQDLGFWHSVGSGSIPGTSASAPQLTDPGAFQQGSEAASLCLFFTAGPATQNITFQVIQNYSVAGNLVNSISGPAPNMPEGKPVVEHVATALQNFDSSAARASSIGSQVSSALQRGGEYVAGAAKAAAVATLAKATGFSL